MNKVWGFRKNKVLLCLPSPSHTHSHPALSCQVLQAHLEHSEEQLIINILPLYMLFPFLEHYFLFFWRGLLLNVSRCSSSITSSIVEWVIPISGVLPELCICFLYWNEIIENLCSYCVNENILNARNICTNVDRGSVLKVLPHGITLALCLSGLLIHHISLFISIVPLSNPVCT